MTLIDATPTPSAPTPRPRRRAAAVAGVVGVAAVVGGGAWAWQVWNAQGPQAAEALPANTLAYLAVDLDPPGGQKVAAFNTLRKLPTLKKELGLGSADDLRDSIVGEVTADSGCDLDASAITSWAGDRAAMAVVPLDEPTVVAAVQVDDAAKAKERLEKIVRECGEGELGYVVGEKWAILAETTEIARQVADNAKGRTLAEDSDFQKLTKSAGSAGVMTAFLAPEAGKALLEEVDKDPYLSFAVLPLLAGSDPLASVVGFSQLFGSFDSSDDVYAGEDLELSDEELEEMQAEYEASLSPEERRLHERMENYDDLTPAEQEALDKEMEAFYEKEYGDLSEEEFDEEEFDEEEFIDEELEGIEVPADLRKDIEGFSGLGGIVRFDDGTLEIETVSDPLIGGFNGRYDGTDGTSAIAALPADTAIAFGGGLADDWGKRTVLDGQLAFSFGEEVDEKDVLDTFEKSTGLTIKDLETIGGDTIAFAAKPGFEKAFADFFDFEDEGSKTPPIAARVTGNADAIEKALAKLSKGKDDSFFQSRRDGDAVVIGPDVSYLEEIADAKKTLADSDAFERALPGADDAIITMYADINAGEWLEEFSEGALTGDDADALGTLGISVVEDGDQYRTVLRITVD
ncbi:DUF3352 domain-containing protein [Nocardioides sp. Root190]|uniref:DUF3352 domain-containing protein n=1 Tax=Nocardioides sp. Root190 TaxID=1736488 RepID=UPI00138EC9B4|nr:DUF3352 domain-containing protein [Nocardioides sp. Root190]